jgi:hypothetical protein
MLKFKVVGQEKLLVPDVEQQYHINPLDDFRWVAGADVQKVWRKQGWVPPSEYREDYLFKKNREAK